MDIGHQNAPLDRLFVVVRIYECLLSVPLNLAGLCKVGYLYKLLWDMLHRSHRSVNESRIRLA